MYKAESSQRVQTFPRVDTGRGEERNTDVTDVAERQLLTLTLTPTSLLEYSLHFNFAGPPSHWKGCEVL